jgi:hypothetical protein
LVAERGVYASEVKAGELMGSSHGMRNEMKRASRNEEREMHAT